MSEANAGAETALVLFSGGQDFTTCLGLNRFDHIETIGFDYGQRHRAELDIRPRLVQAIREAFPAWAGRLGEDHLIDLSILGRVSDMALTREVDIKMSRNGLPSTFVSGRNLVFLTFAAAVAYRRGAKHLVMGTVT